MPPARRAMRRTSRRTARRTSRRVSRRQAGASGGDEYYDEPAQDYEPAPEPAPSKYDELEKLSSLHAQGALTDEEFEAEKIVPVIDKRYALSEVPEAIRYLGEGHARGKVVITI